ncbi:uncharacterized protein LOC135708061 [Ochlerotatus camptorhynchus]|uniref:uncharacterized protein LOC135708061 n=1 Tax=Ochlerotatus camptorhynchus TaxID=644619 RepID=UPI0031CEC62C
MGTKTATVLDVQMNVDIITGESCSKMLQTIVQTLLFQRSQIPFCYQMFRAIVNKIKAEMAGTEESKWGNYQLAKQREVAIKTLEELQTLFKELAVIVENSKQNVQAMVLFGSTVYTAKEAFVINLPMADENHYAQHHRQGLESALKQITKQIILAEELCPSGKFIGPTNTFMLLGLVPMCRTEQSRMSSEVIEYRPIENYQLPASCQKYVIDVSVRGVCNEKLICCKRMNVFSDSFQSMQIEEMKEVMNDKKQQEVHENPENMWYQIGKGIKGYKDVLIRGKSIWNDGL